MNTNGNPYGLNISDSVVDPHMMKNSEWGAVAYLSKNTKYGKGSEIWINQSSDYITEQAGASVNASGTGTSYAYDTSNGQQASTTGNVTGVYDMNGGADEFVAGYMNNGDSYLQTNASTLVNAEEKYKDVYKATTSGTWYEQSLTNYNYSQPNSGLGRPTSSTGHYGDAVWETSNGTSYDAWCNDSSFIPYGTGSIFMRGDSYSGGKRAGIFAYNYHRNSFDPLSIVNSFRVVLPVL